MAAASSAAVTGFLTPSFELSQDADFVVVRIRLPHLKADEGEFYVLDREFKFHLRPYFLRLTFRHSLVEDGRERAEHDLGSGVLTVWLPKATPGEHFDGLNLLTELLRKPSAPAAATRPLIEVIGSSEAEEASADGMAVEGDDADDGDDLELDDDLSHLAEVEQELPSTILSAGSGATYGFNNAYSRVFVGLEGEELMQLPAPEASSAATRRAGRIAAEDAAFDEDHYMADFVEDALAQAALAFVPWWRAAGAQRRWSDEARAAAAGAPAAASGGVASAGAEADPASALASASPAAASTSAAAGAGAGTGAGAAAFGLESEANAQLLQLPRKEFLLDSAARRRALCGLVDLLFAYAYDVRTTEGEPTVESGWTLRHVCASGPNAGRSLEVLPLSHPPSLAL